ncbi:MAG: hypothetical protein E7K47_19665 [Acidovorax sp.]|nr:hypothetical protein [Acidovorax sp.]
MKYRYSGPTSGVTLKKGEEAQEVMLHTGAEVDLPEEHEYTKTLLALGHLTPVSAKQATKTSAATRAGTDDQRKSLVDEPAAKGA